MRKRLLFPLFSAIAPRPSRLSAYTTTASPITFSQPPNRPAFVITGGQSPAQPLLGRGLYGQQLKASGHPLVSKMLIAQRRAFSLQRIDPEEKPLETPPRVIDKAPSASPVETIAQNGERKTYGDFFEQLGAVAAFICVLTIVSFPIVAGISFMYGAIENMHEPNQDMPRIILDFMWGTALVSAGILLVVLISG